MLGMRKIYFMIIGLGVTLAQPALSATIEMLSNGGFETGGLDGWTTNSIGSGTCAFAGRSWNVSHSSSTGCSAVGSPVMGNYAAYAMNDGPGNTSYILQQSFVVAAGTSSASLTFFDSFQAPSGQNRTLSVDLYQSNTLLGNIATLSTSGVSTDWTFRSFDLTSLVIGYIGQSVDLRFTNSIPNTWEGPGGIGLDNISLTASVSMTDVPATVPIPAAGGLMIAGLAGLFGLRHKKKHATKGV